MFGQSESKQDFIVHSTSPLNAEPPLDRLRRSFVTEIGDFYVRCHGNQPEIDAEARRVTVSGSVGTPTELSLADLKARFTPRTVMAVMQRGGSGNLHRCAEWSFCLTAARMVAAQERR